MTLAPNPYQVTNCTSEAVALRRSFKAQEDACNLLQVDVCSGKGSCNATTGNCSCEGARHTPLATLHQYRTTMLFAIVYTTGYGSLGLKK